MHPNCKAIRYPSCRLLFNTLLICWHSYSYRLLCPSCQEPREPCNRYCRHRNLEPYSTVRQHHCKGREEAEQQVEAEAEVEEEELVVVVEEVEVRKEVEGSEMAPCAVKLDRLKKRINCVPSWIVPLLFTIAVQPHHCGTCRLVTNVLIHSFDTYT